MKYANTFRRAVLGVALAGSLVSGAAQADELAINLPVGAPHFNVSVNGTLEGATGGLFSVTNKTTGSSFLAFCYELLQDIGQNAATGEPYVKTGGVSSATQLLFDQSFGSLDLTNMAELAGFQIALWETQDDSNRSTGNYKGWVGQAGTMDEDVALIIADQFLTKVRSGVAGANHYDLSVWASPTSQDLIQATGHQNPNRVPEPGAGALAALGLGGLMMLRRRRS